MEKVCQWVEVGQENVPSIEITELLIPCNLDLENHIAEKIVMLFCGCTMTVELGQKRNSLTE